MKKLPMLSLKIMVAVIVLFPTLTDLFEILGRWVVGIPKPML